jgi:hypothetical protein
MDIWILDKDPKEIKKPIFYKDWGGESGKVGYDLAMKLLLPHVKKINIDELRKWLNRYLTSRFIATPGSLPRDACKLEANAIIQFLQSKLADTREEKKSLTKRHPSTIKIF